MLKLTKSRFVIRFSKLFSRDRLYHQTCAVGITVKSEDAPVAVTVSSIRVLRDIFYIGAVGFGRRGEIRDEPILEFPLESDQFFVLGDNSAASKDGRLWIDVHYVDRRLLLGRAISIVWPHMVPASRHITVTFLYLESCDCPRGQTSRG